MNTQGVRDPDWKVVMDTIRAIHPEVPVIILGGHVRLPRLKSTLFWFRLFPHSYLS
jgi:hypothetical protein